MSLILEAMRKSEAERRRGEMPDLRAELPPPVASRRVATRAWPWLAALALVAIASVAIVLHPWSREAASIPAPAQPTTPPATSIPAESVRLQPRPQAPVATPIAPRVAASDTTTPAHAIDASPVPSEAAVAPPVDDASPPPVSGGAEISINALSADLRKALPPLQLSMHMWDPDPARRFVILDGERHVEGDSVGPMQIRRIDADGVLFDWQGRAVRLPLR